MRSTLLRDASSGVHGQSPWPYDESDSKPLGIRAYSMILASAIRRNPRRGIWLAFRVIVQFIMIAHQGFALEGVISACGRGML